MAGMFDHLRPAWMNQPSQPQGSVQSPIASAVGSSNVLPDFEEIRGMLMGSQQNFLDTQGKIIDTQANKAVEQGVSNLIGSGLAGTSVVGGLTSGVQKQATQAKTDLASRTQLDTDRLLLQYLNLAQNASDRAADRQLSASRGGGGGSSRGGGVRRASMRRQDDITPMLGGGSGTSYRDQTAAASLGGLRGSDMLNNAGQPAHAPNNPYRSQPGINTQGLTDGPTNIPGGGISYEQWWNSTSEADKKRLRLTGLHAPGGAWAHLGANIMARELGA